MRGRRWRWRRWRRRRWRWLLRTNPVGGRKAWGYLVAVRFRADPAQRARRRRDAAVRNANGRPSACARTRMHRWLRCDVGVVHGAKACGAGVRVRVRRHGARGRGLCGGSTTARGPRLTRLRHCACQRGRRDSRSRRRSRSWSPSSCYRRHRRSRSFCRIHENNRHSSSHSSSHS